MQDIESRRLSFERRRLQITGLWLILLAILGLSFVDSVESFFSGSDASRFAKVEIECSETSRWTTSRNFPSGEFEVYLPVTGLGSLQNFDTFAITTTHGCFLLPSRVPSQLSGAAVLLEADPSCTSGLSPPIAS
ncbi:MAG: hypothetical protein HRT45_17805 [Bdellovibrionales bacterium]|nr:hypothetical protein [Bdellovibrionales bacterium]